MTNDNYYAYLRVSTVKQGEGVSLKAQREAIEAYAQNRSFTISRWIEEKQTASKKGRPLFEAMLRDLRAGKAKGLIVHKIDRSARNFYDWAKIGELQDNGIEIHFSAESVDFASRGGRLTADIQAVISADYIRNLREETIKGLNGRLKQGLYPFKAPLGYLDTGAGNPKAICPKTGPLVKQMFELYATGEYSYKSLAVEMNQRGLTTRNGKPLGKTTIAKVLENTFYIGIVSLKTSHQTFTGIHKPLVEKSLFDASNQVRLGRYTKRRTRKHTFQFQALFKCHKCNRTMIAERQKTYIYYRCHCTQCSRNCIEESWIEKQIQSHLQETQVLLSDGKFEGAVRDAIRNNTDSSTNILSVNRAEIEQQLERLVDALAKGILDDTTFLRQQKKLKIQLLEIEENERKSQEVSKNIAKYRNFLELAKNLCFLYEMANANEKRQLLKLVFSNLSIADKNVYFSMYNWVQSLSNCNGVHGGGLSALLNRSSQDLPEQAKARIIDAVCSREMQVLTDLLAQVAKHNSARIC